jgi:hypothetical protein
MKSILKATVALSAVLACHLSFAQAVKPEATVQIAQGTPGAGAAGTAGGTAGTAGGTAAGAAATATGTAAGAGFGVGVLAISGAVAATIAATGAKNDSTTTHTAVTHTP